MRTPTAALAIAAILGISISYAKPVATLDSWIRAQEGISLERMLRNISPEGTVPGTIIASPSRHNPNYLFHWIRDAGVTLDALVQRLPETGVLGHKKIEDFVLLTLRQQRAPGAEGLGEPRYNVDGTADTIPWSRPQFDGPAYRALALMRFLKAVPDTTVRSEALQAIRTDLEYVTQVWNQHCYDLWEELKGFHYYTQAMQFAALTHGAVFFREQDAAFAGRLTLVSREIESELQKYWDSEKGYIGASRELHYRPEQKQGPEYKDENLDTAVVLAALHASVDRGILAIDDERLLATVSALEKAFSREYSINHGKTVAAIGRFTDDVYFGGNPWYVTTAALAEFYYRLARKTGKNDFKAKGDEYLALIRSYLGTSGAMSEQFDRDAGVPVSAHDLTWSYAAFLSAAFHRR